MQYVDHDPASIGLIFQCETALLYYPSIHYAAVPRSDRNSSFQDYQQCWKNKSVNHNKIFCNRNSIFIFSSLLFFCPLKTDFYFNSVISYRKWHNDYNFHTTQRLQSAVIRENGDAYNKNTFFSCCHSCLSQKETPLPEGNAVEELKTTSLPFWLIRLKRLFTLAAKFKPVSLPDTDVWSPQRYLTASSNKAFLKKN